MIDFSESSGAVEQGPTHVNPDDLSDKMILLLKNFRDMMRADKLGGLYEKWIDSGAAEPSLVSGRQEIMGNGPEDEQLRGLEGMNWGLLWARRQRLEQLAKFCDELRVPVKKLGESVHHGWETDGGQLANESFQVIAKRAVSASQPIKKLAAEMDAAWHNTRDAVEKFTQYDNREGKAFKENYNDDVFGADDWKQNADNMRRFISGQFEYSSHIRDDPHTAGTVDQDGDLFLKVTSEEVMDRLTTKNPLPDRNLALFPGILWNNGDSFYTDQATKRLDDFAHFYANTIIDFRAKLKALHDMVSQTMQHLSVAAQAHWDAFGGLSTKPQQTPPPGVTPRPPAAPPTGPPAGPPSTHVPPPGGSTKPAGVTPSMPPMPPLHPAPTPPAPVAPPTTPTAVPPSGMPPATAPATTKPISPPATKPGSPLKPVPLPYRVPPEQQDAFDRIMGGHDSSVDPNRPKLDSPIPGDGAPGMHTPGDTSAESSRTVTIHTAGGDTIQLGSVDGKGHVALTVDDGSGKSKSYDIDFSQGAGASSPTGLTGGSSGSDEPPAHTDSGPPIGTPAVGEVSAAGGIRSEIVGDATGATGLNDRPAGGAGNPSSDAGSAATGAADHRPQPGHAHVDSSGETGSHAHGAGHASEPIKADAHGHAVIHDGHTTISVDKDPGNDSAVKVTVDDGHGPAKTYTVDASAQASSPTSAGSATGGAGAGSPTAHPVHDFSTHTANMDAGVASNASVSATDASASRHGAGVADSSSTAQHSSGGPTPGAQHPGAGAVSGADPSIARHAAPEGHSGIAQASQHAHPGAGPGVAQSAQHEGGMPMMGPMGGAGGQDGDSERSASQWRTQGEVFEEAGALAADRISDILGGRERD